MNFTGDALDRNRNRGEDRMTEMNRNYRNEREKEGYEDDIEGDEEDYEEDINSRAYRKGRKLDGHEGTIASLFTQYNHIFEFGVCNTYNEPRNDAIIADGGRVQFIYKIHKMHKISLYSLASFMSFVLIRKLLLTFQVVAMIGAEKVHHQVHSIILTLQNK